MPGFDLTVREVRATAVRVPMRRPLRTGIGAVTTAPLVLIDVDTNEGVTGHAYLFAYVQDAALLLRDALRQLNAALAGGSAAPADVLRRASQPFRLMGTTGLIGFCLSGLDVACWDILAKATNLPLAQLLGSTESRIRAYNSNGLGLCPPEEAAAEAVELLAEGYNAVKVRLGHPDAAMDVAVVRAIRAKIPDEAILMADYNQSLRWPEAMRRGRALDDEGLYWIEEPTAHDDIRGHARIADALATPVQLGENFMTLRQMDEAVAGGACDLVMPDLERIGGVTGWVGAAALAEAGGLPLSSHLFPEVSCHLLAASSTRDWLEVVDWAAPILADPLTVADGYVDVPRRPGNGLAWDPDAVRHYAVG